MEVNGGVSGSGFSSRNRNSPSSERFIGLFSRSHPEKVNGDSILSSGDDDELDEDDVFWTGDFSQSNNRSDHHSNTASKRNSQPLGFRRPENFGILAALSEDGKKETLIERPFMYRKTAILSHLSSPSSSSRMIPSIPKPQSPREREYFLSLPSGKLHHQSAPVNVPVLPKASKMRKPTVYEEDDEDGEDEMLPPHEIVARGSGRSPRTTFSVLEGVGRTLKGRDLRQVRNAVWRRTGFLD